jgi:hypothetical protein
MPLDFIDHADIERQLDTQLGLEPAPKRERAWDCLAGEAPVVCQHVHIDRVQLRDMAQVVCLTCSHEWMEIEG